MKKIESLFFVLLLSLVAFACTGPASDEAEPAATPQRSFLSLGTAPPGGAFFVVGGALAETLGEFKGDEGWQVTAEATKGTQENIRRLDSGELDLALANAAIAYFAVRGDGGWDRAYEIRNVMTLAPNVALFIAPAGNGVETIADLKGKRVVVGPAGAGFEYFIRPILEAHGVTYDDFTPLNATQAGAVDMLADGSAAAAFLGGAVPTASITQAAAGNDIHFVPYDEAAIDQLVESYLFFNRVTIPAGTYRGLDEDFPTLNVGSMELITSAGKDVDFVYELTKTIYENRAAVVKKHAAGKAINPKVVVRDTGLEFHSGAERYYREIGIWPELESSEEASEEVSEETPAAE